LTNGLVNSPAELFDERHETLRGLNRTELLQLCAARGFRMSPSTPTEALILLAVPIDTTTGVELQVPNDNPIDEWRLGLINFIGEYWQKIAPQLKCPARHLRDPDLNKRDPQPCFKCTDLQVLTCIVQAAEKYPRNEQLIKDLRRKPQ